MNTLVTKKELRNALSSQTVGGVKSVGTPGMQQCAMYCEHYEATDRPETPYGGIGLGIHSAKLFVSPFVAF